MNNSPKTIIAAVAAAAALAAPVAAQAHGNGHGKGRGNAPVQAQERGHGHAFKTPKTRNVIVKGTVASVDGTVVTIAVNRANHHGRAFAGQQVQLDVSAARLQVKDVNGDGTRDVNDMAAGDRVLAQLRVPRGVALDLTQAFATRRLLDVGPARS
jgi:hypothetical protein